MYIYSRQESINYLGYYSGHEQLLQAAIQEQARNFELLLKQELKNARVHCRRDLLWQRLFSWPGKEAESRKEVSGYCHAVKNHNKFPSKNRF